MDEKIKVNKIPSIDLDFEELSANMIALLMPLQIHYAMPHLWVVLLKQAYKQ